MAKVVGNLPVEWSRESIRISGQSDSAKNDVAALICPSSLAKGRYIMRHSGIASDERELSGEYAMPKLGNRARLKI